MHTNLRNKLPVRPYSSTSLIIMVEESSILVDAGFGKIFISFLFIIEVKLIFIESFNIQPCLSVTVRENNPEFITVIVSVVSPVDKLYYQ